MRIGKGSNRMQLDLQARFRFTVGPRAPDPQVALSLLARHGNRLHLPHVKCFCFSPISSFLKNIQPLFFILFSRHTISRVSWKGRKLQQRLIAIQIHKA
jgi:hypothetical protein